ncbi:MAG: hypothetical protein ABEI74_00470 [Candidatus Pacearchaeota archaeon]
MKKLNKLKEIMFSEGKISKQEFVFWSIPILILTSLVLLSFSHSQRTGTTALTTAGSIIFTTVWLYALFPLKEKRKWEYVEFEIKRELGSMIRSLFDVTSIYFSEPSKTKKQESNTQEVYKQKVRDMAKAEKLRLNSLGKKSLFKKKPTAIRKRRFEFSSFELKYFRFMNHSELYQVIKIQRLLFKLENIMNRSVSESFTIPKKKFDRRFASITHKIYQCIHELGKSGAFDYQLSIPLKKAYSKNASKAL